MNEIAVWLVPFLGGVLWGLVVNAFNRFWTKRALFHPSERKAVFFFALRLLINVLAMALVYRHVPVLLGTAVGLVSYKNVLLAQAIKDHLSGGKR